MQKISSFTVKRNPLLLSKYLNGAFIHLSSILIDNYK